MMIKEIKVPEKTLYEQFAASNPANSAWVSANAGSGKTHVLTQRVIRLMLEGNKPDRILCLTFTKAAAANMKNRVFSTLSSWTMLDDDQLSTEIEKTTGTKPSGSKLKIARTLFTDALDTPGGLKIQTIHAFCESLLHQFPLEANLSGHFEVVQESDQVLLLEEARRQVFESDRDGQLSECFEHLLRNASDKAIEGGIVEIVGRRNAFREWIEAAGGVNEAILQLYPVIGITPTDTAETLLNSFFVSCSHLKQYFRTVYEHAVTSEKKTDQQFAMKLAGWLQGEFTSQSFEMVGEACFTTTGTLRTKRGVATGYVFDAFPDLMDRISELAELHAYSADKLRAQHMVMLSRSLFTVAYAMLERYERLKRNRGLVDYDDQISKTVTLLHRRDIRDWIRYRLDRGIDHVLVDEAQDTSPDQWKIINAVTEDFHAGAGANTSHRTVFVVGDEKQSIYSFQGADPAEFAKQQRQLAKKVTDVDQVFKNARLDLSFRSTKDVLRAVDCVFQHAENLNGLTQNGEAPVHDAVRENDPGEVQVWPLLGKEKSEKKASWLDPIDKPGAGDPAVVLAGQISQAVGQWVGKPLPGSGEVIHYKDILVLVRTRDRFITALTRKLKDDGHAVAGADRLRLLEHIAIEDLLSAGKFVLLPEDDLNLAGLLKSVFFAVSEELLFDLSHGRGSVSLINRIEQISAAPDHARYDEAKVLLKGLNEIRTRGHKHGVFDFFAWLLGAFGGRRNILARLGTEAEDVIDAFLDEIMDFNRNGGLGLEAFVALFNKANPEIKREVELERDEVRILTVHASKGLEAKVVFLVDSCGKAFNENKRDKVLRLQQDDAGIGPFAWVPTKNEHVEASMVTVGLIESAAEAEYRRLLYVGMTRAADRLVVCGYHGVNAPKHLCWHQMVEKALAPDGVEISDGEAGAGGFRWTTGNVIGLQQKINPVPEPVGEKAPQELPDWLKKPVPREPDLPRPLTPSGAYALIDEGAKEKRRPVFERSAEDGSTSAMGYGLAVHRLLEVLPDVAIEDRAKAADTILMRAIPDSSEDERGHLVAKVLSLLDDPELSRLFGKESKAEVPVIGNLETQSGRRLISGQVDRLVVSRDEVKVVDFKTNRNVPKKPEDVQPEYISQMALYRHLLSEVFPGKAVSTFLLWTENQSLMALPESMLDAAVLNLKKT